MRILKLIWLNLLLITAAIISTPVNASTLDDLKKKGVVACGVSVDLIGFSSVNKAGRRVGMDADLCRAIAAATLGDAEKVKFILVTSKERFTVLQSGKADVVFAVATWTLTRDTALGLNFAGVNYYDGQGFMVRKSLGLKSALELNGATICSVIGSTSEQNVADYFEENNMTYRAKSYENGPSVRAAYDAGECDSYSTDQSSLAARRLELAMPEDHMLLPEVISREPLGPIVRHGDDQWLDLVKWTLMATLQAEALNITSKNVDEMKNSNKPAVLRLLGVKGNLGAKLGVDGAWAYRTIKQVGNYAEIFDRNLGDNSRMKLPRGVNALWKNGGLQYPMPVR